MLMELGECPWVGEIFEDHEYEEWEIMPALNGRQNAVSIKVVGTNFVLRCSFGDIKESGGTIYTDEIGNGPIDKLF